jgi:predicted house-cleaning noncanonical NTP pyrophosphatase (MazG superfamily)
MRLSYTSYERRIYMDKLVDELIEIVEAEQAEPVSDIQELMEDIKSRLLLIKEKLNEKEH